jgi:threonine dehydrogenase-like Zn-dependent dehydrogenase
MGNPWVVVFGLGAVGNFASQSFAARGCRVIGIDPVEARRKVANRCGIAATITGTSQEIRKQVKDLTGGAMGGIVIDAVGHSEVVQEAVACAANFGQVVILGSPRVPVEGNMTPMLSAIHCKFITVRGALEWCLPMYPDTGTEMSQYQKHQMIFDWMARGLLKLEPLISHRLPPEKISEAYEGLETDKGVYTGVALEWK